SEIVVSVILDTSPGAVRHPRDRCLELAARAEELSVLGVDTNLIAIATGGKNQNPKIIVDTKLGSSINIWAGDARQEEERQRALQELARECRAQIRPERHSPIYAAIATAHDELEARYRVHTSDGTCLRKIFAHTDLRETEQPDIVRALRHPSVKN